MQFFLPLPRNSFFILQFLTKFPIIIISIRISKNLIVISRFIVIIDNGNKILTNIRGSMKKILLSILILSVVLSSGCVGNRISALERFKEKNPIDGMLFSKNIKTSLNKPSQKKLNNKINKNYE